MAHKTTKFNSEDTTIDIEGANGIRITGENLRNLKIELKIDGEWVILPYISKLNIFFDAINILPEVTITQLILPEGIKTNTGMAK